MGGIQRVDRGGMVHLIERAKPRLRQVATRYLSEDRACAIALSMWSKDSRLRSCSTDSFLLALYKACQYGLDPSGVGNQGHIIAYKGRAEFVRGWGGVITMAARRQIKIDTFAVYDADEFEVIRQCGADGYFVGLHHKEVHDGSQDLGEVKAAYAVATHPDWKQPMIEVVWRHDIEKIRTNSASPNSPAWKGWYSEMARKTAVNRLAKRLPLFIEVKEIDATGKDRKKMEIVSSIPNEDTFYEGRVGNSSIDESIDRKPLLQKASELRSEFPEIYIQVTNGVSLEGMSVANLHSLLNKIEGLALSAETASAAELSADLGF